MNTLTAPEDNKVMITFSFLKCSRVRKEIHVDVWMCTGVITWEIVLAASWSTLRVN